MVLAVSFVIIRPNGDFVWRYANLVRGISLEAFCHLLGWVFAIENRHAYSLDARNVRGRCETLCLFSISLEERRSKIVVMPSSRIYYVPLEVISPVVAHRKRKPRRTEYSGF